MRELRGRSKHVLLISNLERIRGDQKISNFKIHSNYKTKQTDTAESVWVLSKDYNVRQRMILTGAKLSSIV